MPILVIAAAVFGLAVGSFLNVVICRVPAGQSIVRPASHCPKCDNVLRTRDNIPLVSWIALRGRCAHCSTAISVRYPLVECLTAGLFVALTVRMAQLHQFAALPAYLFFASVGVALAAIDLDVKRLPDAIVRPAYVILGVLLVIAATADGGLAPIVRGAIGSVALFGFFLMLALIYPAGMGFGDVKFAGVVGAALGYLSYATLLVGTFLSFVLGGTVAAVLMLSRRAGRKSMVPFGPAMAAGAIVAIFAAPLLSHTYLHFANQA